MTKELKENETEHSANGTANEENFDPNDPKHPSNLIVDGNMVYFDNAYFNLNNVTCVTLDTKCEQTKIVCVNFNNGSVLKLKLKSVQHCEDLIANIMMMYQGKDIIKTEKWGI